MDREKVTIFYNSNNMEIYLPTLSKMALPKQSCQ